MTSPNAIGGGASLLSCLALCFSLSLRRDKHGPELKRVPVPPAYVRDFEQELLLTYALRRGMPSASLEDIKIEMKPIYDSEANGSRCRGIRVTVVNSRDEKFEEDYGPRLFSDVASQAFADLVANGELQADHDCQYELLVDERVVDASTPSPAGMTFAAQKPPPLQYLTRSLRALISEARPVDEPKEDHFSVFYTADAYERAERFSRLGAAAQPPRETGAALVGTPCSCPETGEFFVVITDALQATDAEEDKVSLSYTGKTWLRLQAILKSIQSQEATCTYRFLGQAHGHNFVPLDGAPPCELCATAKVCSRTSVFVSTDDRTWTQAVFAGAPYSLCHIFGLNARLEQVHGLYSLRDNRLTQRGFYILPDFDPTKTL